MHTAYKILLVITTFLFNAVAAADNLTSSNGFTASGPFNILVSFGLEYILPIDWAYLFYNFIAIALLYYAMSMASQRYARFFAIIIPLLAGMFAYFGWFNNHNSSVPILPLIIATSLIGVGIYLKGSNKENYGSGGPGLTLINFVYFIILLQACVGLVNNSNIWNNNIAPTPDQYQNVDLQTQIGGLNNMGGFMGGAISTAIMLLNLGIQACMMMLSILVSIVAFSVVLVFVFPFLSSSPLALAILGVTQIVVWLLYAWFIFIIFFKPPALDQLGVG